MGSGFTSRTGETKLVETNEEELPNQFEIYSCDFRAALYANEYMQFRGNAPNQLADKVGVQQDSPLKIPDPANLSTFNISVSEVIRSKVKNEQRG
jgi:hypothetical protein